MGVSQLRQLSLSGTAKVDLDFSTDNLIQLHMADGYAHRFLNMLRHCPRVIDCTFTGVLNACVPLGHTIADQLESLDLVLNFERVNQILDIFNALTTPALRKLAYQAFESIFPHRSFISLMARSSCSLRALALIDTIIPDDQLIECSSHAIPRRVVLDKNKNHI
jgi:hypothetical protein